MLKTKKGFILRRMGSEYMVVAVGAAAAKFNGMIQMNETGAFFWKELEQGITEAALVAKMLNRFEGLDEATARTDLREFLSSIDIALEQ